MRPKSYKVPLRQGRANISSKRLEHVISKVISRKAKPLISVLQSMTTTIQNHISKVVHEEVKQLVTTDFGHAHVASERIQKGNCREQNNHSCGPESQSASDIESSQSQRDDLNVSQALVITSTSNGEKEKCNAAVKLTSNARTKEQVEQEQFQNVVTPTLMALATIPLSDTLESGSQQPADSDDSNEDTLPEPFGRTCTPPNSPLSCTAIKCSPLTPTFSLGDLKEAWDSSQGDISAFVSTLPSGKTTPGNSERIRVMRPTTPATPIKAKPDSKSFSFEIEVSNGSAGEITLKPELPVKRQKEPVVCEICSRNFPNNSSLRQHISFHRPQRPYQCQHNGCNKSYKTRSELNRHIVVHSGEKNYECQKCGKKFLRKQYLKTHLLRHDEPLTWSCYQCAKLFVSEDDLNKHVTSYHKTKKRPNRETVSERT